MTASAVTAAEVLTQRQAWQIYDQWIEDIRSSFIDEPPDLESEFRKASQMQRAASKDWADSHLIAFARSAGFRIVTFDKGTRSVIQWTFERRRKINPKTQVPKIGTWGTLLVFSIPSRI